MYVPSMIPAVFLILASSLSSLCLAQTYTSATLVYPSSPIGATIWTPGTTVAITWSLPSGHSTAPTSLTIELGTGSNTSVTNSGIFPVPTPGVAYPSTLTVNYAVPSTLAAGQYCLIFVGYDAKGTMYGPNWTTWFNISAGPTSTTTTSASPASPTTAATPSSTTTLSPAILPTESNVGPAIVVVPSTVTVPYTPTNTATAKVEDEHSGAQTYSSAALTLLVAFLLALAVVGWR